MLKLLNKFRKDNTGFTLVELIVTMAVFAIVMVQVSTIMMNCSKLFVKGADNIDLQGEAQRIVQFTEEIMIDTPKEGNITSEADLAVPDSDIVTIETIQRDVANPGAAIPVVYQLRVKKAPTELYGQLVLNKTENGTPLAEEIVADYVKSISVNMANYAVDDRITVNVSMQSEDYSYDSVAIKDIYLRNHPGTKKSDSDGPETTGKYMLEVLRYKHYNVASLTGLGTGYTYTLDPDSGTPGDFVVSSDGSDVHCQAEVCKTFGKKTSAKIIVTDGDGNEVSTIALDTKKVRVGLGSEGSDTGSVVCYGDVSSQQLKVSSYADVTGISLDPADFNEARAQFKKNGADIGGSFSEGQDRNFNTNDGFRLDHFFYDYDDASNALILHSQGFFVNNNAGVFNGYISANGGKEAMKAEITVKYDYGKQLTFNVYFAPVGLDGAQLDNGYWQSL